MDERANTEGLEGKAPNEGTPPPAQGDAAKREEAPEGAEPAEAKATQAAGEAFDPGQAVTFRTQGARNDATAELGVSPDRMLAEATFYPAVGEGIPLSMDYVRELLARLGVVAGILWDDVSEAVMHCNLDRKMLRGVAVARGSAPIAEIPEHTALEPKFMHRGPLVDDSVHRVDFRELSSVFVVHADETIARIVPRRPGVSGSDVLGAQVPFPRESPETCSAGKNVVLGEGGLAAAVDGRLTITGGRLDVDEVLIIKEGVDFHTGHIAFPGDVVIEGQVHDGFRVHSGGSIVCKSTLDAFEIEAKKDLVCPQGIIGRRRAQIRVGGELSAKYLQNCKVAVRGNAHIAAAIVNSRVLCLGSVDLGDKGVVMGGELHALHGLRCGRLGNQACQRTIVRIGTDFTVEQKLAQANERMRLIAARARQIDSAAAAHPGPDAQRAKAEIAKAAAATRNLVIELMGKLDADDAAIVDARGEIFPGVVIEICRVSIVVDQVLKSCKFRLDKAAGRIVVEK